jgi:hypothetical protein
MQEPTEIRLSKDSAAEVEIGQAIAIYLKESKKAAEHELKAAAAKKRIYQFASRVWLLKYSRGFVPPSPFKIFTPDLKQSVKLVVQDCTDGAELKPEALDNLRAVIDNEAVAESTEEKTVVALDAKILGQRAQDGTGTVADVVASRLDEIRDVLTRDGDLAWSQAESLFTARCARVIKPNFLARLPAITGLSPGKLDAALQAIGGCLKRYVQA